MEMNVSEKKNILHSESDRFLGGFK